MSQTKAASLVVPAKLVDFLRTYGGNFAINYNPDIISDDKWTAATHFGREAEDSPMAAGAAYGLGVTAADALGAMLGDLKL